MTQRTPFICKKKEILEEKVAELQKSFTLSFFLTPCSMKKRSRKLPNCQEFQALC